MIFLYFTFSSESLSVLFPYLSLIILIRFANRSAWFMSAYSEGLTGAQACWANKKYHGHHTLPPEMVAYIKQTVPA